MIKENKPETECYFCCFDNINDEGRVITSNSNWYAFVPKAPEIFGHTIVTYRTDEKSNKHPHIQNIICKDDKRVEILKVLDEGIKTLVDGLKEIENVDKIYFAMLGETERTHMHYHLFPRFGFVNEYELINWVNKDKLYRLTKGNIRWQKFYANPTCGFKSFDGFQYLGEIEKSYSQARKCIGDDPPKGILKEMAKNIRKIGKL